MAYTLSKGRLKVECAVGTRTDGTGANKVEDAISLGSPEWPKIDLSFSHGTSDNQADTAWGAKFSLATNSTQTLTLRGGAANCTNGRGEVIQFSVIKLLVVTVYDLIASKQIRLGGTWAGFGARSTDKEIVRTICVKADPLAGQAVSADQTLTLENPSGAVNPTAFTVAILGLKV
jgi:hypothetical protein